MNKTNVIFSVFVAGIFMLLTSCGGGSSSDNPIVGSWKIVKAEGVGASASQGMEYTFKDEGKAIAGSGMMESEYTYTVSNDTLSMDYQGLGTIVLVWTFTIDGDKMTMKNTTADQEFWLEK